MPMAAGLVPGTTLTIGEAPAAAMAITYLAMANSIGLAMANGVSAQQRGQLVGEAATVKIVATILQNGAD